jgi:hypothetical protein
VRACARSRAQGNNLAKGTWHDVVSGLPATYPAIQFDNFCDALCPNFLYNTTHSGPTDSAEVNFRSAFDVTLLRNARVLDLDGIDDCLIANVEAGTPGNNNREPLNEISTGFTAEAWVVANALQLSGTRTIFDKGSFRVYVDSTVLSAAVTTTSGTFVLTTQVVLTPLEWSHVAATYDGVKLTVFYNSVSAGVLSVPGGSLVGHSATQLHMGCSSAGSQHWGGRFDEMRIWNLPRAPAQIAGTFDTTIKGNEMGLVHYQRMDRIAWWPVARAQDSTRFALWATLTGAATPTTSFVAEEIPAFRERYRFAHYVNHVDDETHTVDMHQYVGIRQQGTIANRPVLHDNFGVPTVPHTQIFNTGNDEFADGNYLFAASQWSCAVVSAPLTEGNDFGAALAADYEPVTACFLDTELYEIIAARPDLMSALPQVSPLAETVVDAMTTEYSGRVYFTGTQANDALDELAGEVYRREISYAFSLSIWTMGGVLGSFNTHELDFSFTPRTTSWDGCDLQVEVETAINQIDTLPSQGTTELRDCRIETLSPYTETGPRMGLTYGDTACTTPFGTQVFFDNFAEATVGAEWNAPGASLVPVTCPNASPEKALALQSGIDTVLTIPTPDPHSHVHLTIAIIAEGPWTGAPTELIKVSALGIGDLALSTLSTSGASTQSFPNSPTGTQTLPTDLNSCGLAGDTAFNVLELIDTAAIPHTGPSVQITVRTINAPAGARVHIKYVSASTFTAETSYCNQAPPPPPPHPPHPQPRARRQ